MTVLWQNRLRWYGHLSRKNKTWVKKMQGQRKPGVRLWKKTVGPDNKEDAMDCSKWSKLIRDVD